MEVATQITKTKKWISIAFLVIALIGFADSTFLAFEHYKGVTPPCSIVEGCEEVTTSKYSAIGPVPIALLGSLYYLAILVLTTAYLDSRKEILIRLAAYLAFSGFAVSLILIYLQLFVIHAICLYCMGSATTSTILAGLGIKIIRN
jgi:uncharacterized membrane protein